MPTPLAPLFSRPLDRVIRFLYRRICDVPKAVSPQSFLLPVRRIEELYPGIERMLVEVPASQAMYRHFYALPLPEYLLLGALCRLRKPRRIFEIGTYNGSTTLLLSQNSPADCEIYTLDLPPDQTGNIPANLRDQVPFVVGQEAKWVNGPAKIRQLYGDSTRFDFSPYWGQIDFIFIDANHSYPFAKNDSEIALRMLAPGGIVVWDDYVFQPEHPECRGVSQWLEESKLPNTFWVHSTRMAIHQAQ